MRSRAEISYETYGKALAIEAHTMADMASRDILPAVISFISTLADSIGAVRRCSERADVSVQESLLIEASDLLKEAKEALSALLEAAEYAGRAPEGGRAPKRIATVCSPPWRRCARRWTGWRRSCPRTSALPTYGDRCLRFNILSPRARKEVPRPAICQTGDLSMYPKTILIKELFGSLIARRPQLAQSAPVR